MTNKSMLFDIPKKDQLFKFWFPCWSWPEGRG